MTNIARLSRPSLHLIAAVVTPFRPDGSVDAASLIRLVQHLKQHGVDEYFVVGSTGEAPLLDRNERLQVVENVRKAESDGLIYAGVSGTGHKHAIRNATDAAAAGADVAVLMSPYFVALTQDQLLDYVRAVADASPIPVAVYHHLRMPTPFAVSTVARLSTHPNIIGIKDTAGSTQNRCSEILAATEGRPFLFFQGVENLTLSTLAAGGHGCVVAQGCIAPWLFRSLFDAWASGDLPQARRAQDQIDGLWSIFSKREVQQSFLHFLHTLRLPLQQRCVIASTTASTPHVSFPAEYDQLITEHMRRHLGEVPASLA